MKIFIPQTLPALAAACCIALFSLAGTAKAQPSASSSSAHSPTPAHSPAPSAPASAGTAPVAAGAELSPTKTVVTNKNAYAKLVGDHSLSLQWISWDKFGKVTVTDVGGVLQIEGEHRGDKSNPTDFLTIKGTITEVDDLTFTFEGTIVSQVSHIAKGEPVTRQGTYTFAITKNRPYWRLQEMNNPKDNVVDYVDIYFRKTPGASPTATKPSGSGPGAPKKPKKQD